MKMKAFRKVVLSFRNIYMFCSERRSSVL